MATRKTAHTRPALTKNAAAPRSAASLRVPISGPGVAAGVGAGVYVSSESWVGTGAGAGVASAPEDVGAGVASDLCLLKLYSCLLNFILTFF